MLFVNQNCATDGDKSAAFRATHNCITTRGLRCNALLDAILPSTTSLRLVIDAHSLQTTYALGLCPPSIVHSLPGSKMMISQEEILDLDMTPALARRRAFLKLPLEERRKVLAQQADQVAEHYESELERIDREQWQGGDIVEY